MARVVVIFNLLHIYRVSNAFNRIKLAGVTPEIWVVNNAFLITFEVPKIHRIEANQSRE